MQNLKKTPVFPEYEKYGGKMVEYGGFYMPVQFATSLIEEHNAVRNFAGLFDVSHMGEVEIKGKEARKFINSIITNDITNLEKGKIIYTFLCYEDGGIVDDLTVYCLEDDVFWLVVNAANTDKDFEHIISYKKDYDVEIINLSEDYGLLALQGPYAEKLLQKNCDTDISDLKGFTFKNNVKVFGKDTLVSRTGYTGEDGFEIYCSSNDVAYLFNALLENGEMDGGKLIPIGLGARDTLRFEAGMPLYGNELSKDVKAVEVGFNFAIKLDKEDFVGKDALVKAKANPTKKLIGLELTGRGIPRHGYEVYKGDKLIGTITTGYNPPTVQKPIAVAYIDVEYANIGEEVTVRIRNKEVPAKLISKKFKYK